MSTQLPVTRTVVTLSALAEAIWRIWPEAEEVDIAIIFGKLIAENGWPNPNQTTWNWNIGNIRGVSPEGFFHVLKGAWELVDQGKVASFEKIGWVVSQAPAGAAVPPGKVCMLPPPATQGFRAYSSLEEGVADYLAVMDKSFKAAKKVLDDENSTPSDFVDALKAGRYFTGDGAQYKTNVTSGYNHAMKNMVDRPASPDVTTEREVPTAHWTDNKPEEGANLIGFVESLAVKDENNT